MVGMGVDLAKIPNEEDLRKMLSAQLTQPYEEKQSYCIIWQLDDKPIGHSNINKIIFGEEAHMHLHLWKPDLRKKGMGTELVKLTIPYFFKNMKLKKLYCEPYALNPAPNKTLEKIGFDFVKEHITIPGYLNFEQPVKLWVMSLEKFNSLYLSS
jgi:RimJ/RimL family protein N-acetyltransferase